MKNSILRTLIIAATALLSACTAAGSSDVEDSLRMAEDAAAMCDMTVAESVASHLLGSENLSHLTASQLGRLSIVYMQMADADTDASTDHIATATDLYQRAYKANADSAELFYSGVAPEHLRHVAAMASLAGSINNPIDMSSISEFEPDSLSDSVATDFH